MVYRVLAVIAGAMTGVVFSGNRSEMGLIFGVAIALALYEVFSLRRRVSRLEQDRAAQPAVVDRPSLKPGKMVTPEDDRQPLADGSTLEFDTEPAPDAAVGQPDGFRAQPGSALRDQPPLPPTAESAWESKPNLLVEKLKDWFTTGNVPVKVGVIVSFFGVAFLLKYAVERNLLAVPMWLRLGFAALFGVVLLVIGWRLRKRMRVYALSLQGGGVGIIYLTVFAAFRLYGLLPPVPAFVLLALITVPAAMLAVVQNARAMAVLAVTGGFLAPILTSTGQGSHVALFSYYLMLNGAIVGIAWFKSWRELNLAGFLFTFVIGTIWGYKYYRPEYLASTEPFLIAHFLLYQVAAILFAFRQSKPLRGVVDGTLIFGTPIVAFGLQAALLAHTDNGLTYSAVALAIFYSAVAWWLYVRHRAMGLLRDSYVVLAVAFATVAVPLALNASWTAATWAMEGAALVWLSVRQSRLLSRFTGVALIVLAGGAFVIGGWNNDSGLTVLNGNVLGGTLLSLAGFISARNLGRVEHQYGRWSSIALFVWGMGWWIATGLMEIDDRVRYSFEYPARVAFLALSGAALSLAGRQLHWRLARIGSLAMLPLLTMILFERVFAGGHPLESNAAVPWLLAGVAHLYVLKPFEHKAKPATIWHVAGVLFSAGLLAREIDWWIVVETWSNAATGLMLTVLTVFCLWGRPVFAWPLQKERWAYVTAAGILLAINLLFITAFSFDSPGDPLPLPYLPLLNPYTVVALAALVMGFFWITPAKHVYAYGDDQRRVLLWLLGGAVFVLSTIAVVRGVHHYADVPWRQYSLTRSVEVQSALSIYWGLLGFGAMVLGARRHLRWLWLAGAGLMALVVIKLFLVDLGNSGTVARIVSFLGVGALLLVVGRFAPAPPRA